MVVLSVVSLNYHFSNTAQQASNPPDSATCILSNNIYSKCMFYTAKQLPTEVTVGLQGSMLFTANICTQVPLRGFGGSAQL